MSKAYLIEAAARAAGTRTAGLIVVDAERSAFFAAHRDFASLETVIFRSPAQAERAVRRRAAELRTKPRSRAAHLSLQS